MTISYYLQIERTTRFRNPAASPCWALELWHWAWHGDKRPFKQPGYDHPRREHLSEPFPMHSGRTPTTDQQAIFHHTGQRPNRSLLLPYAPGDKPIHRSDDSCKRMSCFNFTDRKDDTMNQGLCVRRSVAATVTESRTNASTLYPVPPIAPGKG